MDSKRETRRWHSGELKAAVLAECNEPGASVAAIALAHGLNANLVHRWRKNAVGRVAVPDVRPADGFIALTLPTTAVPAKLPDILIELLRGPTTVTVNWPMGGAGECAAWLRDWLR